MVKKKENKIVGLTACILAMVLICSVAEAQDITTGLVAHWELDGNANDSVGGFHGTLVGDPCLPTWMDGPIDGAIDFDCTDGDDARYVNCVDSTGSALDITGDRSMAVWFKIDDWNAQYWTGLFTKGGSNDGSYNLIQGRLYTDGSGSDHGIAFQVKGINQYPPDGVKRQQVVRGAVTVDDGEWHLAVGTFHHDLGDGTGLLSIYVDGVLDADYVVGAGATATNDNPIWINGQYGVPPEPYHTGFPNSSIDDARIYSRALTAEDVAYMYSLVTINRSPQVDAGTFKTALVDTATQLDADVSDDGQPEPPSLTYAWSKLSGPGTAQFSNAGIEDPTVTLNAIGAYELQLSVSDGDRDACDVLDVHVRATDDPVAHWTFENDGTGTGTNVVDRSPNNNFGTFAGDPEPNWVSGWVGDWSLDVADNSYVKITTDPVADPNLNAMYGAVTVSAWVKVDDWLSTDWDGIVTKGDGGAGGVGGWSLLRNSSNDSLAFHTPGAGIAIRGSVNVKDGYWHHVVGVHNGTTKSLYVDGLLDGSAEAPGLLNPNTAELWINGNSEVADRFFDGQIDDVRIYNYGLDIDGVQALTAMGAIIPVVDAGEDQVFLMQGGFVQLDATVKDDGNPVAATLAWTQESGPGTAAFSNDAIEDPCVTFTEIGEYVLRLTADDTIAVIYDEVTITVENPTCQDVADDGLLLPADLSGPAGIPDCYIDLHDFAAFASNWLRCNNPQDSECEFPY